MDPIGFAGRDVNLYRYAAGRAPSLVDPWGLYSKPKCKPVGVKSEVYEIVLPEGLNIKNPAAVDAEIKKQLDMQLASFGRVFDFRYTMPSKNTAGTSGFLLTAKLNAAYNDDACCCDYDGSELGVLGFYAVINEQKLESKYLIPGTNVLIEGTSSTREHERWHVLGVGLSDSDYLKYEEESGVKLPRKIGYVPAATQVANRTAACAWQVSRHRNAKSDGDCLKALKDCGRDLFGSEGARTWIDMHGLYHGLDLTNSTAKFVDWQLTESDWSLDDIYYGILDKEKAGRH
jgi:hypothetical protein